MNGPAYAAIDWGTSSFRLWLVDGGGGILAERRSLDGMMAAGKLGFAAVLDGHLAALEAPADLPAVICGMAGARQGWVESGYIDTPAPLASIPDRAVPVPGQARDIRILPGIAQRDPGAPDVMRGEETQLLGALGLAGTADALACLPGTHSKWIRVDGGTVRRFSTFMTGELFGVVTRETILLHAVAGAAEVQDTVAFRAAVRAAYAAPARAANLLFQARSSQLLFGTSPASARGWISGTLIGLEIAGGLAGEGPADTVTLIAAGGLESLYRTAFETLAIPFTSLDADEAALGGLSRAAAAIWR